jgi:hypothetical protein
MAEYIGMNKLKWLLLVVYGLYIILLRIPKLAILSKLPIKKDIYILSWYSGLGNNIIQLAQAEYLAEQAGFTVHVPPHNIMKLENKYLMHDIKPMPLEQRPYFPKTSSSLFFDLRKKPDSFAGSKLALFRSFYFRFDMQPFSPRLGDYRRILRRELLPVLPHYDDPHINDDTLVIHIRSGDVFGDDPSEIPKGYIQPPLSYYLEIINKFGFKDIVVVTEKDLRNPCIKQLKALIPDIKIQTADLINDMSTIMSAKNLIVGQSSFSLCLGLASDKLKRMFIPQFEITNWFYHSRCHFSNNIYRYFFDPRFSSSHFHNMDIEVYLIKISKYVPIGEWRNNEQQNTLMLEHSRENLVFM